MQRLCGDMKLTSSPQFIYPYLDIDLKYYDLVSLAIVPF